MFLTTIDVGEVFVDIFNKSPIIAVFGGIIYWAYRELNKKDEIIKTRDIEKTELVTKVFATQAEVLVNDANNKALLQNAIDSSIRTTNAVKEGVSELKTGQKEIKVKIENASK